MKIGRKVVHSIIEVAAIGLEIVVFLREIGREWSGEEVKMFMRRAVLCEN